jgi:hypothetical protein
MVVVIAEPTDSDLNVETLPTTASAPVTARAADEFADPRNFKSTSVPVLRVADSRRGTS